MRARGVTLASLTGVFMPQHAHAAPVLDGATMNWLFAMPLVGLLLSIAIGPLLFPNLWHRHYGKIATAWSLLALVSMAWFGGIAAAGTTFVHAMLAEYLSFMVLLFGLYTVAGGILVSGDISGTPRNNLAILALGTAMASIVGTTGAAMILIRPLIRANISRAHNRHVVIFFIILVANVGGALSPLGDPPLFVGFLHGVDFFWPLRHLWIHTLLVAGLVLATFFVLDCWHFRKETHDTDNNEPIRIHVRGLVNLALIAL